MRFVDYCVIFDPKASVMDWEGSVIQPQNVDAFESQKVPGHIKHHKCFMRGEEIANLLPRYGQIFAPTRTRIRPQDHGFTETCGCSFVRLCTGNLLALAPPLQSEHR